MSAMSRAVDLDGTAAPRRHARTPGLPDCDSAPGACRESPLTSKRPCPRRHPDRTQWQRGGERTACLGPCPVPKLGEHFPWRGVGVRSRARRIRGSLSPQLRPSIAQRLRHRDADSGRLIWCLYGEAQVPIIARTPVSAMRFLSSEPVRRQEAPILRLSQTRTLLGCDGIDHRAYLGGWISRTSRRSKRRPANYTAYARRSTLVPQRLGRSSS